MPVVSRPLCLLLATLVCALGACSRDVAPAALGKGVSTSEETNAGASQQRSRPLVSTEVPAASADESQWADRVRGRVVGPDGKPLRGVGVTLYKRTLMPPRQGRVALDQVPTGGRGQFVFNQAREPGLEIEVVSPGHIRRTQAVPESLDEMRVRLERGYKIDGRVVLDDGTFVVGCQVVLDPGLGVDVRSRTTFTDARGAFSFQNVPPASMTISARDRAGLFQPPSRKVIGSKGLDENILQFRESAPGLEIRGVVHSLQTEKELAGAEVLVYPNAINGLMHEPFKTHSGEDGRFRLRGLGKGEWTMEVRHEEHSTVVRNLSLSGSRGDLPPVEMGPRARVAGRLSAGKDAAGLRLTLVSYHGEIYSCEVGANGSFDFGEEGVSQGPATLELQPGKLAFANTQSLQLPLVLTYQESLELQIGMTSATRLDGIVRDPEGQPLSGVVVSTSTLQPGATLAPQVRVLATTDAEGRFVIRGLPPEPVDLRFGHERFAAADTTVSPVDGRFAPLDLQLSQPGSVVGQVTRRVLRGKGEVSVPLAGSLVYVGQGTRILAQAISDAQGRFRLDGLAEGAHIIKARFPGLPIARHRTAVEVTAGSPREGIELSFPAGRRVRGLVTDSEELPISGFRVASEMGTSTQTDSAGRFSLEVPHGYTELILGVPGAAQVSKRTLGPKQNEVFISMHLVRRGNLRARIIGMPSGKPVEGVLVGLAMPFDGKMRQDGPGASFRNITEAFKLIVDTAAAGALDRANYERWVDCSNGQLYLENVPVGEYRIYIYARGYSPHIDEIEIKPGEPEDLGEIRLQQGGRIQGQVLDARSGKPVRRAKLVLGRESFLAYDDARVLTRTDKDGRFTLQGVALGARDIFVAAEGLANTVYECKLPADLLRRDPVQIRMRRGASVHVKCIATGRRRFEPVRSQVVVLHRGHEPIAESKTGEDGRAYFHNLSPGIYYALVRGSSQVLPSRVTVGSGTAGKVIQAPTIRLLRPVLRSSPQQQSTGR